MSNSKFPLDKIKKIYYLLKDKYFDYYLPFFYKKFKYTEAFFFKSDIQTNLHKFLDKNKVNAILEIGTFEGLASIWFSKKYLSSKNSNLDIVDPFFISDTTTDVQDMTLKNFEYNYSKFKSDKTKFFKTTSDNFFLKNKKQYDFIYIDGSHELEDIQKDLENADKALINGGIIWCDDYLKPPNCKIPMDEFYENNKDRYKIIFKNFQIAFKKII